MTNLITNKKRNTSEATSRLESGPLSTQRGLDLPDKANHMGIIEEVIFIGVPEETKDNMKSLLIGSDPIEFKCHPTFAYPSDLDVERTMSLAAFVCPYKCEKQNFKEVKATSESLEKLFKDSSKGPDKFFYLALNSDLSVEDGENNDEIIDQIKPFNPTKVHYYFCLNIHDYVFQKKDNKHFAYLKLPKFVCLKSFIPNGRLFESILKEIEDYVFTQRLCLAKQIKGASEENVGLLNSYKNHFESKDIILRDNLPSSLLLELLEHKIIGKVPKSAVMKHSGREFHLLPSQIESQYLITSNVFSNILELFCPEEIMLFYSCLVNEISLLFVSSSMKTTTSAV